MNHPKEHYINFLKETEEKMEEYGKTWEDVKKITHNNEKLSIENFKKIANKKYYPGYGRAYFTDYMIIGKDWWLERWEYEGAEGWKFRISPFI